MKNKYYLCSILLPILMNMPQTTDAQTAGENYIVTETMLDANGTNKVKSVQYYDGLGRPNVLAANGINTKGTYLYTMTEYDNMGRESKVWLPAVGTTSPSIITDTDMAYKSNNTYPFDGYAFSELEYDALGRLTFRSTPGKAWHNKGKGIKTDYITNTANSVRKYTLDSSGNPKNTSVQYYPANSLTGKKVTDEDGHFVETYRDLLGNVVLERRNGNNDTYYVYDRGLLKTVIPPLYPEKKDNSLLYKYEYDGLGRCTKKILPGNVTINYWYDRYGRVSFMQDARLLKENLYRFYLYDGLNRLAIQGTCSNTIDGTFEAKVSFNCNQDGLCNTGYSITGNQSLQNAAIEIANYYDGYDFLNQTSIHTALNGIDFSRTNPVCATTLQTGSVQSTSDSKFIYSVYYYDERGNVIDSRQTAADGAVLSKSTTYSFTNQPKQTITKVKMGYMIPTVTETYTYDSKSDKLASVSLNSGSGAIPVTAITYDDLGRVMKKANGGTRIQTSYSYDLHGWLTSCDAKASGASNILFHEDLHYADTYQNALYNGNISMARWATGDFPMGQNSCNGYKYYYDGLNRLTSATYGLNSMSLSDLSNMGDMGNVSVTYDANSNITHLTRSGKKDFGFGVIDDLTYSYNGNRLNYISDAIGNQHYEGVFEFTANTISTPYGAPRFGYDGCGAITYDTNRGITNIDYDLLGNPKRVQFNNGNVTEYIYSADGTRLKTTHKTAVAGLSVGIGNSRTLTGKETQSTTTIHYFGNFVYDNGYLKYYFADGYTDGNGASYVHYYIKDHQGNNRVVAKYDGTIEQTTHYYPYGGTLTHSTNQGVQKYKYNGKEFDRTHGLDWYDYSARQYDPASGRFTSMDPLCEKYYNISPYSYCAGNPIRYVDPDGRDAIAIIDKDNNTINIVANYYVNTKGCNECRGYNMEEIRNLNKIDDQLNKMGYQITDGIYKNYKVYFRLAFIADGSKGECNRDATFDYYTTNEGKDIPIGNVFERGYYFDNGEDTYIGGITIPNNYIIMNAGFDDNGNKLDTQKARIHEIFHTFGFDDDVNTGKTTDGIMNYQKLQISQSDINKLVDSILQMNK